MTNDNSALNFDHSSLGDQPVPPSIAALGADESNLEWHNELGGLTFDLGDRFVKWNPRSNGLDLKLEWRRLAWLSSRHPAPKPIDWGEDHDAQWMVTEALAGESAVGDQWRARTSEAVRVIAEGLQAIHALPIDDVPEDWVGQSWVDRTVDDLGRRPPVDDPVLVHGDACAPNTLISPATSGAQATWVGHVDVGDLTVGDRWADLAIASMSLDWNFGPGHQEAFFEFYGVEADAERIRYYRALWESES